MAEADKKIVPLKIGVRFKPPAIVLFFEDEMKKCHRRTMPVRGLKKSSFASRVAQQLKEHHLNYLDKIPNFKIEKMVLLIQQNMKGNDLEESLNLIQKEFSVDPEENLNTVDEETLKRKKDIMDETFEKHRKKPGDDDFEYDVEVEFAPPEKFEKSFWDSEEEEEKDTF